MFELTNPSHNNRDTEPHAVAKHPPGMGDGQEPKKSCKDNARRQRRHVAPQVVAIVCLKSWHFESRIVTVMLLGQ